MTNLPAHGVAEEVRALLARRRLSQSKLAAALGLSQAAVSRRLSGEVPFDVNELAATARYLDVPLGQLVASSEAVSA